MSVSQLDQVKLMNAVECETATANATKYSDSWHSARATGSAALFIVSTAGRITITQQCSDDNVNWYAPVDTANGALGVIRNLQTVTPGLYVAFSPVLTEWMRFKVVENLAKTYVSLTLILRTEV